MNASAHLEPLLDGTPLAIERIKYAWPGLSTSDRAYLLTILLADPTKQRAVRWPRHREQLVDLALMDENAYVRYLAARSVSKPWRIDDEEYIASHLGDAEFQDDVSRFKRITSDPVDLVRAAHIESDDKLLGWLPLSEARSFWRKSQAERLVLVDGVKNGGKQMSGLLLHAATDLLPADAVTIDEMCDVLLQYLGGASMTERIAAAAETDRLLQHGIYSHDAWESVRELWEVIPHLPRPLQHILLERLPDKVGGEPAIPSPDVLAALDDHQREFLLWRDDLTLQGLRRKAYEESTNESLRQAAISSTRFELRDADISRLLFSPQEPREVSEKKVDELIMLAEGCRGATIAQMDAILVLLSNVPDVLQAKLGEGDAYVRGGMLQTQRAKQLSREALLVEVHAARVLLLALRLAPFREDEEPMDIPEGLMAFRDKIVPGNPWQTYLNLLPIVRPGGWKKAVGFLPDVHIRDFELPEAGRKRPFNLVQEVQSRVNDIPEQDRAQLAAFGKALQVLSSQVADVAVATRKQIDDALQVRINRLIYMIYLVVGVWLAVSLVKWLIDLLK